MSKFDETKDQAKADLREEIRTRVALAINDKVYEGQVEKGYIVEEEDEAEDDEQEPTDEPGTEEDDDDEQEDDETDEEDDK